MAEKDETYTDEQADKDFGEGFGVTVTGTEGAPPKEDTNPEPAAKTAEELEAEAAAAKAVEEAANPPPPPAPETVTLTKEQFDRLTASADKTDALETKMSTVFGTMGNMKQVVERLQAEAPKGAKIDLPEDVVAELAEEYPDLAVHIRKSLEKALSGVRGTGTAEPAVVDDEKVAGLVAQRVIKHEMEALQDEHPNWRTIVGVVDKDGKHDPKNEFRAWLAKEPAEYQTKINGTNSSAVISRAISRFQDAKEKAAASPPPPKVPANNVRKDRIRDAVQPKSSGAPPTPPTKTEDDAFAEGFVSG